MNQESTRSSRREFLRQTLPVAAAAAAFPFPTLVPGSAWDYPAPSRRVSAWPWR